MRVTTIMGILLVALGVMALVYQGISYTKTEELIDFGPIHATTQTQKTIPLPPMVGGLALVGGIVLLALGPGRSVAKELR